MTEEYKEIEAVFKIFVESTLIEHNSTKSLSVISDDVIGIGMGDQGIVSKKEELVKILNGEKRNASQTTTSIFYEQIQIRCYENLYGSICGILKIQTTEGDETHKSSLGQMMSVRKENGKWWIYAVQATPLFNEAERDPLTDLYNKKYSEIKIDEKLDSISPINRGAFFMLDLDHFKDINDTYGHQEGDAVLKKTADHIKALIRRDDIAGRIGGDEFCIYFHGDLTAETVEEKAVLLCEGIRSIISLDKARTSCSIGIVFCNSPDLNFKEIYTQADEAMYKQKKKGRDGYTVYKNAE